MNILKYCAILVFAAISLTLYAAKSTGEAHVFAQPDGTTISVQLLGDEDLSWYQAIDGALLIRTSECFYIASIDAQGELGNTGILAHNLNERSEKECQAISSQDKALFFSKATNRAKSKRNAIAGYPKNYFCPHSGTVRVPVILMNYSDMSFTFTDRETWQNYFNGEATTPYTSDTRFDGYGSVRKYFSDASQGKLNFEFDLYGPYTADSIHDYYGKANKKSLNLLIEAVKKADADIDFTQYDSNNDGRVDMVYILYAGTGANSSGNNNDFWPTCWNKSSSYATADGMSINIMGGASELAKKNDTTYGNIRAGIGVTCHEISHGLGMPDLYWTLGSTPKDSEGYTDYNNCGPEDWDLMDGGENLYNSMWPCQYTAWEREILGWLEVQELNKPQTITLHPLNKEGGKACRVTNPDNPYEYYIIENYQSDEWNYYINSRYGSGLMITHVNSSSTGLSMTPNNTYGHPNVTILPADGFILAAYSVGKTIQYKGEVVTMPASSEYETTESGQKRYKWNYYYYYPETKGDPYVGTMSPSPVTSVAAYKNYTGEDMVSTYPITDITRNSDGSITFNFMGGTQSGDANNDGIIDINDIVTTTHYILDPIGATIFKNAADINHDNEITTDDLNAIKDIILKKK